jgi:hypothetical protein
MRGSMPWVVRLLLSAAVLCLGTAPAFAQDEPPRIGPFAIDLRGVVPKFGASPDLAASRGLQPAELPGIGFGVAGGLHVYLPKVAGVTVGLGAEAIIGRAHSDAPAPFVNPSTGVSTPSTLHAVTETLKVFAPQLSLNFGNGNGWSYLSVGVGRAIWSITPDGVNALPADEEILNTFNYGGGARWFMKKHLAFSLDVRLYDIANGTPQLGYLGSPRTVLFVVSAGIAVK